MAPSALRLRHPSGVSTLHLDLEASTVQDLLQKVFAVTEIAPSQQDRMCPSAPGSPMRHAF